MQRKINGKAVHQERNPHCLARRKSYVLRLYFSGQTPRSESELVRLRNICKEHFGDQYEVVPMGLEHVERLSPHTPIYAPSVAIGHLPYPIRESVRILSSEEKVLWGVQLEERSSPAPRSAF